VHRFFVYPHSISGDRVAIPPKLAHQIKDVLRLKAGDRVVFLDNSGFELESELTVSGDRLEGRVLHRRRGALEPRTKVTLAQALIRPRRFEAILELGTQIGVSVFQHVLCQRGVAGGVSSVRFARWRAIIQEAAELSRRSLLPILKPVVTLEEACRGVPRGASILVPWEQEREIGLKETLKGISDQVFIFIGPEGGFTQSEIDLVRSWGGRTVSLGRRIFRSETAALVACVTVLWERGELHPE